MKESKQKKVSTSTDMDESRNEWACSQAGLTTRELVCNKKSVERCDCSGRFYLDCGLFCSFLMFYVHEFGHCSYMTHFFDTISKYCYLI